MKPLVAIFYLLSTALVSCAYEDTFTQEEVKNGTAIDHLPKFKLLALDSVTEIKSTAIPKDKITLMVFLDPTCHHCKQELASLKDSLNFFVGASVALVSPLPISVLKQSAELNAFKGVSNVTVAHDPSNVTQKIFNGYQIPMTLIYDKEKRLRVVFRGEVAIAEIAEQYNKILLKPIM